MIYMCGSDLESDGALASYSIRYLMDSDIDYDNIKIYLCAGGSTKWYNSNISTQET